VNSRYTPVRLVVDSVEVFSFFRTMPLEEKALKTRPRLRKLFRSPVFISGMGFAVRSLALCFAWHRGFENGPYAFEAGRVAQSIALGHGFSSPLATVLTGPTAWLCPIFPYLMAGVFRIWGTFTFKSLAVIQILNCIFASLTIFPIYATAKRSFGMSIALLASWLWVFLPSAINRPVEDIWDTTLTALLFALIFWATLAVREKQNVSAWAGYGALWALGALTNAAVISVFPFFLCWLVWDAWKTSARPARLIGVAFFAFVLMLVPWTFRNYRVFGVWIPLRSNFGLELWLGNNPAGNEVNSFSLHPFLNPVEGQQFKQLGEIAYMAAKHHEAITFIHSHPGTTLRFILRRIAMFWFSVTDRPRMDWSAIPLYIKVLLLPNFLMILFAWAGAIMALRTRVRAGFLFAVVLLVFPLPYYVTHALVRYRFPIDPVITVLSVYGIACTLAWAGLYGGILHEDAVVSRVRPSKGSRE